MSGLAVGFLLAAVTAHAGFGRAYTVQNINPFSTGRQLLAGDFNGDGRRDLLSYSGSEIWVLPGRRSGGFDPALETVTELRIERAAVEDRDGDGTDDLVVLLSDFINDRLGYRLGVLHGRSAGGFGEPVLTATVVDSVRSYSFPSDPAFGDFDGDGLLDLVFEHPYSGEIFLTASLPAGGWRERQLLSNLQLIYRLPRVVDVDGDGVDDLLLPDSSYGADTLYVVPGGGNPPLWQDLVPISLPAPIEAVLEFQDLDGNDSPEILVSLIDRRLSLLTRGAEGRYESTWTSATPLNLDEVLFMDLTGDLRLDLILLSYSREVNLFEGLDNLEFASARRLVSPADPEALAPGPFGDGGATSLAVLCAGRNLAIYQEPPALSGATEVEFDPGVDRRTLLAHDINRDGRPDLVFTGNTNSQSGTVQVSLNTGSGRWEPPVERDLGIDPAEAVVADFDRDGYPDLLVAARLRQSVWIYHGQTSAPYFGYGRVVATLPEDVWVDRFLAADLDRDGWLDLVASGNDETRLVVLRGRGEGSFDTALSYMPPGYLSGFAVVDLHPTPGIEIVVQEFSRAVLTTFRLAPGNRLEPVETEPTISFAQGPFFARVTQDCLPDLVLFVGQDRMYSKVGLGNGTFSDESLDRIGRPRESAEVRDFNGDGIADIAYIEPEQGLLEIHYGYPEGGFAEPEESVVGSFGANPVVIDLNGDGALDLLVADSRYDGRCRIHWGDGLPASPGPVAGRGAIRVASVTPNPTRSRVHVDFEGLQAGETYDVLILDAQGRRVGSGGGQAGPSGPLCVEWDGETASGRPAASGLFFIRVTTVRGSATARIVRLP